MSSLRAQTRVELTLTARRGESLLLILGIPMMLLVFFSAVDVLPSPTDDPVDFLAPGIMALAVMSTAMVGLGIATGFERSYGVLKRLGSTPLTRGQLLTAKTISVVLIELVQLVLLALVSVLLGWSPDDGWAGAVVGVVLGTMAFAGLGMAMAGTLRGEINLAAANGLYVVLLLLGGMVVPLDELPSALRAVARLAPAAALAEVLHGTIGAAAAVPGRSWVVLAAWAVGAPLVAARVFRWE